MRFSTFAVGAFAASVFAAPAPLEEKRQLGSVVGLLNPLLGQVTAITGAINATANVAVLGVNATVAVNLTEVTDTIVKEVDGLVQLVDTVLETTEGLTNLTNVGGVLQIVNGLLSGIPVVSTVTGVARTLPIVGNVLPAKRQIDISVNADLDGVADLVSSLVAEITATIENATKVVPGRKSHPYSFQCINIY